MQITAESHTYDGTGRAGFTPLEPITTSAKTRAGILKAWSRAVSAEYARKITFQEDHRATVEKLDALACNGVWIAEGHASDGAHRYRMTATAEQGAAPICGVFEVSRDFYEYAAECERLEQLREKYATRPAGEDADTLPARIWQAYHDAAPHDHPEDEREEALEAIARLVDQEPQTVIADLLAVVEQLNNAI